MYVFMIFIALEHLWIYMFFFCFKISNIFNHIFQSPTQYLRGSSGGEGGSDTIHVATGIIALADTTAEVSSVAVAWEEWHRFQFDSLQYFCYLNDWAYLNGL